MYIGYMIFFMAAIGSHKPVLLIKYQLFRYSVNNAVE